MRPDTEFRRLPKSFWAYVRSISEDVGYTLRGEGRILVPTVKDMIGSMSKRGLDADHMAFKNGRPRKLGRLLRDYFQYRADTLNKYVEPRLM